MNVRHLRYQTWPEAWQEGLGPWLEAMAQRAWLQTLPVGVLAPSHTMLARLKADWMAAGGSALGLQWWTPGRLRAQLLEGAQAPFSVASRELLQLVLKLAAAHLPGNPAADAARRGPGAVLAEIDLLDAAGWEPREWPQRPLGELGRELFARLEEVGLKTTPQAERWLAQNAPKSALASVALVGFGSEYASRWPLLRALRKVTQELLVLTPEETLSGPTETWANALEDLFGAAEPLAGLASAHPHTGQRLLDALQNRLPAKLPGVTAVRGRRLAESAQYLARRAANLAAAGKGPVAVVVPKEDALIGRSVVREWAHAGLPHFDGPAEPQPLNPAETLLRAWLTYQREPIDTAFLGVLDAMVVLPGANLRTIQAWRKSLGSAISEALTGDLRVLWQLLPAQVRQSAPTQEIAAEWLEPWPHELSLDAGWARWEEFQRALGLPRIDDAVVRRLQAILANVADSPTLLLDFLLAETAPSRSRSSLGREPFARLWLVGPSDAAGLSWEHLLFAGWEAPGFPPTQPPLAWLDSASARRLNDRATQPSKLAFGERILKGGHTLLPLPGQREAAYHATIERAIGAAERAVEVTYSAKSAGQLGEQTTPAALWERVAERAGQTIAILPLSALGTLMPYPQLAEVWQQRRTPEQPFNEFSFCLAEPPEDGLKLACGAWERLWRQPAHGWFEHILTVRPLEAGLREHADGIARGGWIHDWVQPWSEPSEQPRPFETLDVWKGRVNARAKQTQQRLQEAFQAAQRGLPDWWTSFWRRALSEALASVETLAPLTVGRMGLSELSLVDCALEAESGPSWALFGRFDLVMMDEPTWPPESGEVQIVDYKSSSDRKLTPWQFRTSGTGIQIALYARMVAEGLAPNGQVSPSVLLLRTRAPQIAPLSWGELMDAPVLWQALQTIQQTGRLGSHEPAFDYRGTTGLPLATLPIPTDILRAKWESTHACPPPRI